MLARHTTTRQVHELHTSDTGKKISAHPMGAGGQQAYICVQPFNRRLRVTCAWQRLWGSLHAIQIMFAYAGTLALQFKPCRVIVNMGCCSWHALTCQHHPAGHNLHVQSLPAMCTLQPNHVSRPSQLHLLDTNMHARYALTLAAATTLGAASAGSVATHLVEISIFSCCTHQWFLIIR